MARRPPLPPAEFLASWRQRDLIRLPLAAGLLGTSVTTIYRMQVTEGVEIVKLHNLSYVRVPSLARAIDRAPPLSAATRSHVADKAQAAHKLRDIRRTRKTEKNENENEMRTETTE